VRGAGVGARGIHPDLIVGDDVLDDDNALSSAQRKRMERWWFGTVGGMSHPGVERTIGAWPAAGAATAYQGPLGRDALPSVRLAHGASGEPDLRVAPVLGRVR
jgi:hypothetical protein